MKINVIYSKEKDIDNYINSVWRFRWNKHGREDIQEKITSLFPPVFKNSLANTKDESFARTLISDFLDESIDIEKYYEIASCITTNWQISSRELISLLESVYDKMFPFDVLTIYLTSLPICPYSYQQRWIMVSANKSIVKQLNTILHELNHFMFYYYFPNLKNVIGDVNFECLKEAFTVLTNKDEVGYPDQQKLREWIKLQKGSVGDILNRNEWKSFLTSK